MAGGSTIVVFSVAIRTQQRLTWLVSQYLPGMYPLDGYVDQDCTVDLTLDGEGALTTALMTASAHNDYISYQAPTNHTRRLIANTISYLNGLLNKNDNRSRNSAICIMIHLASVAMFCGEYDAASTHISGLFEVLRLYKSQQANHGVSRITSQTHYNILEYKIERVAFCQYYITGHDVPFFSEPPSWEPLDKDACLPHREVLTGSPKLDSVFYDFQALCRVIQQTSASQLKVEAQYFRSSMHSLQARVIALSPGQGTPFAECLRLAITAAITSQTQLPMRRLDHHHLNDQFRYYLPLLECPADEQKRDVVLWIIMAAFIVAFHAEDENVAWAESLFRDAAGDAADWEAARLRVMNVTWIPGYIDAAVERAFNALRKKWPLEGKITVQESQLGTEIALPVRIAGLEEEIERF
ncbi:hypothetical protein P171DRAFT_445911 [Karstenula rhodostoma CBS 690.94]|uniref:Transcription factor domain-containing protein n=1 Tax=Karstenula rhodostoma CBS 690.94 TaxID=1392251 RepID=A0A9P4UAJ9_9PLEO|nr:hypothetical protein P171DRAFT_445911 [Karstenula rhodostoma CBS 690.94]